MNGIQQLNNVLVDIHNLATKALLDLDSGLVSKIEIYDIHQLANKLPIILKKVEAQ